MIKGKIEYSIRTVGVNRGKTGHSTLMKDVTGTATVKELLEYVKEEQIDIAKDVLKEEQSQGFDKKPVLKVDNQFNKKEESVKYLGKIEYYSRNSVKKIILDIYKHIIKRSPILTGEYGAHNAVTHNGKVVAENMAQLKTWIEANEMELKSKDTIRFINMTPYARKLERLGVSKGKYQRKEETNRSARAGRRGEGFGKPKWLVPNGAYALTYKALKKKYGNNSFLAFRFLTGSEVQIINSNSWKTGEAHRRSYVSDGRPYLYPTIILSIIEEGITQGDNP